MGETGCGKTRLIRYMCDLQSWGSGGYKTMLMMKVFILVTYYKNKPCLCIKVSLFFPFGIAITHILALLKA